jgi:hypothetical protein
LILLAKAQRQKIAAFGSSYSSVGATRTAGKKRPRSVKLNGVFLWCAIA